MTAREIATVRWGSPNARASLYGTALTLRASGEILLSNPLMPSGTTMQEWYSFTDYQTVRGTPTLPLLHQGKRYRLEPAIESIPAGTVIFEVRCFDRFDELVHAEVLHPPAYAFDYPECHHYTIRLVNGGCDELRFAAFTLSEVDDGER